ncbi:MAG: OmpA family protein [Saprospiraceae bacterium]
MEVIRTKAVDRSTPVTNVFVDADNQKWVGNLNGLFQVFSPEQGSAIDLQKEQWSLLQTHDGNYDLRLPLEDLITQMGDKGQAIKSKSDRITTATYNVAKDELWVGTQESGLFEFKTNPALRLVKRHHTGNSKIPSDQVNTMLLDSQGRLWVGTYGGTFLLENGKWDVKEKGFSFSAYAQNGTDVWTMGDNLLWKVNSRGSWNPIDIDEELTEGDVADIAFDKDGLLWVVSEIVARYDPATEEATVFGPAIGFTSQDVYCVAVDNDNGVWIGTNDKGLYLIQKVSTLYVAIDVEKNISCGGVANDGRLKVVVSGGEEPYSYKWINNLQGANPSNLGPGEYTVTVTDSKGKSNTAIAFLDDPNLVLELKQGKQSSPDGAADGSATVNVSGGKPGYSYQWDSGEKAATAFKLEEGEHLVTVTDKNGCTAVGRITIGKEIAGLNVKVSQTKNIDCAGAKSAEIKAEATGGKSPFNFKWSDSSFSGETVKGLAAGNYSVTVSDASGQTATAEISIKEPTALMATAKVNAPASTGNSDGKATVEITGGTGSYKYKWSNGETTQQAIKLGPAEHSVTVLDGVGCETIARLTITENILPLTVSISQKSDVKCAEGKDGSLEASVQGGKGPYQYSWSGGGVEAMVSGLGAGNYEVTVTDVTGATASDNVQIKEPKAISLAASVKSPASTGNSDGKATAKASGGTGDLSYKWSNGESDKDAVKLGPGEHTVSVTDINGCVETTSINITENILELNISISQTSEIKCAGDKTAALETEISGGKGPFSLKWNSPNVSGEKPTGLSADQYEVTVTDAVGNTATAKYKILEPQAVMIAAKVDAPASTGNQDAKATVTTSGGTGNFSYSWDNGESTKTAMKLAPGQHTVTATDAAGCEGVAIVDVSENILPLSVRVQKTSEVKCTGGSDGALKVEIEGGKAPFTYVWSQSGVNGDSPSNLGPGRYAITVTDITGQTSTGSIELIEPQPLEITLVKNRPTTTEETTNGRATVRATGGTAIVGEDSNYRYKWDNGETSATAEALAGGGHTVTVVDANGCSAELSLETKVRIIPELSSDNLRTGSTINLNRIYFQPDSTNMDPTSIPTVDELYEFLVENANIVIEVGGHTNGVPSHEYCDKLSTERAKSVAQYLVDKGIPASQLRYKGYGKRNPIATNSTEEGRAKNQRVEIKVLEVQSDGG